MFQVVEVVKDVKDVKAKEKVAPVQEEVVITEEDMCLITVEDLEKPYEVVTPHIAPCSRLGAHPQ